MSIEGEVERKVNQMTETVFDKYNPGQTKINDEGEPYILKDDLREYILDIMKQAGQEEFW